MTQNPQELFIDAGENISESHPDVLKHAKATKCELKGRWDTPRGRAIIQELESCGFSREATSKKVGRFYGKLDLRGIDLSKRDLSGADLSEIDFFSARLEGANLSGSNLNGSHLSESNLEDADLSWTKLENTFFDGVGFNNKTNLLGINTNEINSNLAILLVDQANTQQRIANFEVRHPIASRILWAICDYGRSIRRLFLWILLMIAVYSIIYMSMPEAIGGKGLLDSIYFSVVTATTLGYGDLTPATALAKVIAISQVIISYIFGGLLVAIIARRMITLSI